MTNFKPKDYFKLGKFLFIVEECLGEDKYKATRISRDFTGKKMLDGPIKGFIVDLAKSKHRPYFMGTDSA